MKLLILEQLARHPAPQRLIKRGENLFTVTMHQSTYTERVGENRGTEVVD